MGSDVDHNGVSPDTPLQTSYVGLRIRDLNQLQKKSCHSGCPTMWAQDPQWKHSKCWLVQVGFFSWPSVQSLCSRDTVTLPLPKADFCTTSSMKGTSYSLIYHFAGHCVCDCRHEVNELLGLLIMKHLVLSSEKFQSSRAQAHVSVTTEYFWNFCENKEMCYHFHIRKEKERSYNSLKWW